MTMQNNEIDLMKNDSIIDPIFNMYKVRFPKMDELEVIDYSKKKIRFFITLETVLETLVNARNSNHIQAQGIGDADINTSLISNIINMGQHYRLYAAKCKKECEVYLYCNYPHDFYKNGDIVSTYRAKYVESVLKNTNAQFIADRLANAFKFLEKFIKYCNEVYLITERNIESSLIPYIIMQARPDEACQDIIVSNSKYDFQYVNYGCTVLVPRGDNSQLVMRENVMDIMKNLCGIKTEIKVTSTFVPFIASLLGDKWRSIPKIRGVGMSSILKVIERGLNKKMITNRTTNLDMLSDIVDPPFRELFRDNYMVTDITLQYLRLSDSEKFHVMNQIEDRYDENTFNMINERYFFAHPIMVVKPRSEQIVKERYEGKSLFS